MFTTKVHLPTTAFQISHLDKIVTLGSCFAENMGKKMAFAGFDVDVNPFGVLYNPASIHQALLRLIDGSCFTKEELIHFNDQWLSFQHSTLFSDIQPEACLEKINERFLPAVNQLQEAKYLLITFGTAWIYEQNSNNQLVANCHKIPAKQFNRRRLSVREIVALYDELLARLKADYPDLEVIFTVSPIRHWKDGAHENNISKSILLLAIDELQEKWEQVSYFPAYELMMDELRDYRYYAADMLHPCEVAVDYIWQQFSSCYFNKSTADLIKTIQQLKSDLQHRPIHPQSKEFAVFQQKTTEKHQQLLETFPFLEDRI